MSPSDVLLKMYQQLSLQLYNFKDTLVNLCCHVRYFRRLNVRVLDGMRSLPEGAEVFLNMAYICGMKEKVRFFSKISLFKDKE